MCGYPEQPSRPTSVAPAINISRSSDSPAGDKDGILPTDVLLIYLHGFLSSPQSEKARQTLSHCQQNGMGDQIVIPAMSHGPRQTASQIEQIIRQHSGRRMVLMGSSLGGFYASYFSEKYGFPAALINPAVRPFELWESHLGEQRNFYTDEVHLVTEDHIQELLELDVNPLKNPQNFMLLLQTGDETLDYRQAAEKFAESCCIIRQNGSHSYENFEAELPLIFDFFLSRIGQIAR